MLENYLIKGLLVGLVFGVPAGAIGALTIQRSLTHGFWAGLVTGLGSSAADILYACVGVFGLTLISDFLLAHQAVISIAGGVVIILLGINIFRKKAQKVEDTEQRSRLPIFFSSSFAIAIMNPATILAFIVAFSSFGIADNLNATQGTQLICGILLGTGCWWAGLSGLVCIFRSRVTDAIYHRLNQILGILMVLFGLYVGLRTFLP